MSAHSSWKICPRITSITVTVQDTIYTGQSHPGSDPKLKNYIARSQPNALRAATEMLEDDAGIKAQTLRWDVMKPLPLSSPDATPMRFDSMSLFYLLHYMPGLLSVKTYILGHLGNNISSNSVLCGANILDKGEEIRHNMLGQFLMWYL
jgi:hypothetical protein